MQILVINGVDITPFIKHQGYKFQIEDLDASAQRSMSGTLTRDRVARVPTIDVDIKAMLRDSDVSKILKACEPARVMARAYNPETSSLITSDYYCKVKYPSIYSNDNGIIKYKDFSISLKGFRGI